METTPENKRKYTIRTKEEKRQRLEARLTTLKQAHQVREKLIAKLELKLHTNKPI